ncbi:MAG: BolA/IbaG family iron-sulfur metabolism protein [Simkaniaceae bacterium]|nr:BolA/IbaG family iron-sulfur metabolism protein [Simkaniaceae bacterium]
MADAKEIEKAIAGALRTTHLRVHSPRQDDMHFEAIVVSPAFEGLSPVQRHRLVTNPLAPYFKGDLHALSIKTFTPDQWSAHHAEGSRSTNH